MRIIDGYKDNILRRTKEFSVQVILLSSELPKNPAGFSIADQLVRAGTSIGANLIEAQEAVSPKDFLYKITISLKEAKETYYWLDLLRESQLVPTERVSSLAEECEELVKILVTTTIKLKTKQSKM